MGDEKIKGNKIELFCFIFVSSRIFVSLFCFPHKCVSSLFLFSSICFSSSSSPLKCVSLHNLVFPFIYFFLKQLVFPQILFLIVSSKIIFIWLFPQFVFPQICFSNCFPMSRFKSNSFDWEFEQQVQTSCFLLEIRAKQKSLSRTNNEPNS